jgi:thiol-disulfide isomerase/thioredoxin
MAIFERIQMPPLDGATGWLNSEPLGRAELRGHVVLVDFWTFTCINWLRTEPYVRAWSQAYRDDGLIVVGVHSPEFAFEHDLERVRQQVTERAIDYPVALDNDFVIWSAFDNHYWPAAYFVDRDGIVVDQHFGEGRYEHLERVIQRLLGVDRGLVSVTASGAEAEADWGNLRSSETYLGHARGLGAAASRRLGLNQWGLVGRWTTAAERVVLDEPGGGIVYRFHARDAHLVLSRSTGAPIPFRVLLDGKPPGRSCGGDLDEHGNGVLDDGRLYQLVRQRGPVDERTLEITFDGRGAEAYVFTFG